MQRTWLNILEHGGFDALGAAVLRLAATAEAVHRADLARTAANGLSLCREDDRSTHGRVAQPADPSCAGSRRTEVAR